MSAETFTYKGISAEIPLYVNVSADIFNLLIRHDRIL